MEWHGVKIRSLYAADRLPIISILEKEFSSLLGARKELTVFR